MTMTSCTFSASCTGGGAGDAHAVTHLEHAGLPDNSIDLDKALKGTGSSWTTQTVSSLNADYSVATARSNRWPGAVAVAFGTRCVNMYIGWGVKTAEEGVSVSSFVPEIVTAQEDQVEEDLGWL